jgi:hypothetical protein
LRQGGIEFGDRQAAGTQTYRVTIAGDRIVNRRRAEEEDTCGSETYEPI